MSSAFVDVGVSANERGRRPPRIAGTRGVAADRAVVDLQEVVALEARVPATIPVPTVPQPEAETPVDVPLDDEELAALPRPVPEPPAAPLTEEGPSSPAPADSFMALPDAAPLINVIPPDTHGAVGPNHLAVMLNSQVRFQDKTGGALSTVSLNGFWSAVGGGSGTFDPRVIYDPYANRWIAAACDDGLAATSSLLVGVSQTSDPTGSWNLYKIDDLPGTLWYDFPSIGINKDWIVVQANIFTVSTPTFTDSYVYALNKADFYAGGAGFYTLFTFGTTIGATQVPALTYDSSLATAYLVNNWNSGAGALRIHTITGAVGSEVFTSSSFVVSPVPWNANGPDAPQSGLPDLLDSGDARMQKVVYRNGSLWAAQTVFPNSGPPRAAVQWWKFLPNGTIQQRARIDDPSGSVFYAYPSIAVSANDDVLVGYSRFSATQFASANYSFRFGSDALNTLQSDYVFKPGEGPYEKYFGSPDNRWGDYSNAAVDPVNDRDLWTIQEYAAPPDGTFPPPPPDTGRWGTWWARVATTPTLSIDDVSVTEGDSGTVTATFNVTLSRAVLQTVQVNFTTTNGTATTGDGDYVATSGTVTFTPGQTSRPVNVTVQGDVKFEANETFTVDLSSPANADILDGQGGGTIQNDDPVPSISVDDVVVPEGMSGTTAATFTVSLSNPSSQAVTAVYGAFGITALPPIDFAPTSGTVTFAPDDVSETVSVDVNGDTTVELDETFQLQLSTPVNATFADSTGLGTIQNDDPPGDAVAFFTVTSKPGQNWLEWVNPSAGPYFGTVIRYNVSSPGTSDCAHPTAATGAGSGTGGIGPLIGPGLGGRDSAPHGPLADNTKVCYTAYVQKDAPGTIFSGGVENQGRPFTAGSVKWALSMGGIFSMIPPGNGVGVVHAVAQDGSLHAAVKGDVAAGGTWPTTPLVWMPQRMSGPSQGRPSGIATSTGSSTRTIFLSSQDGHVYAFNAETGALSWISPALAPPTALQAHPSGVFTVFGGTRDYVFVGTREGTGSKVYALNLADGTQAWVFDGVAGGFGRIGAVNGQAAVDQLTKRFYFTSRAFGPAPDDNTVWCVDLETGLGLWAEPHGDIDTPAALSNGRLFVGTNPPNPTVKAIDTVAPNEGVQIWSFAITPPVEGPAKGYVAVDRISGSVYFSTATKAWALNADMTPLWLPTGDRLLTDASTPVFAPQDAYVYYGGGDGKLHRLFVAGGTEDVAAPFPVQLGDGTAAAGSPTYDLPGAYMYVGTEDGVVYAVQLP